ncbi:Fic family protein [Pedobacter chinensis]|uniref:Fic family protein n=1 Tax=Pedobacter chinensis TaxID=2282421 RepID=A0A369PUI7_9SPHI|nr:Fic family protein [Pedobacter chinensis]RDC56243.1 Fic family protein [Pedobacter chinensis]
MTPIQIQVINYIKQNPLRSSNDIHKGLGGIIGYSTLKRLLTELISEKLVVSQGKLKGTRYDISPEYNLLYEVNTQDYFQREQDERLIKDTFDFSLIKDVLAKATIFTIKEREKLDLLHLKFLDNIAKLSGTVYDKEMERLAIDLSWKSSQIEGNTYSLLETERLLKEKQTASGKPKDDAVMLLNHKEALNFIIEHKDYVFPLSIRGIEDIHTILIRDLDVERSIRHNKVGITGTNYVPLDNEYQIREALTEMCTLINEKESPLEKSLLTLVLLSYIQPFADGNKRTARIVANAILIASGYCPISFRTVDSIAYKEAMLVFYELNNISAFKKIFIDQFEFAVKTYF